MIDQYELITDINWQILRTILITWLDELDNLTNEQKKKYLLDRIGKQIDFILE